MPPHGGCTCTNTLLCMFEESAERYSTPSLAVPLDSSSELSSQVEERRQVHASLFPQLLLLLHLTQLDPTNLPRNRLGQAIHKLNLARILIGSRNLFDVFLQLRGQFW